jgi:hypothetical protein
MTNYPKPVMRDYQKEYIYNPIMDVMADRISTHRKSKSLLKFLALSTSSGKTFTACNFVVPAIVEMGCDVIYTVPNCASIEEVTEELKLQLPDHLVWGDKSLFGGNFEVPKLKTGQQMVAVMHPTVCSSGDNREIIADLCKDRKVVFISDEAHLGLTCPDAEYTRMAFGGYNAKHEANWFDAIVSFETVAWFMISATPRAPVFVCEDTYDIISEYYDREVLCASQKAIKKVVFYTDDSAAYNNCSKNKRNEADDIIRELDCAEISNDSISVCPNNFTQLNANLVNGFKDEVDWLNMVTKEFDLPATKPAGIIQTNGDKAHQIYHSLGVMGMFPVITTTRDKQVYGFAKPNYQHEFNKDKPNSAQAISFVGNYSNEYNVLVANKIVGEAVNLRNANFLVSDHYRDSCNDTDITTTVEQLLGRVIRWPDVEGINNWKDAIEYREARIADGVPRDVMDRWIDIVFKYEVHMAYSAINAAGVKKFLSKHTFGTVEWANYLKRFDVISRARYGTKGTKTPWSQEGTQEYKAYRDDNPHCEICPRTSNGIPACEASYAGRIPENHILERNEVHHIDGDHSNNDLSNLVTVCPVVHYSISVEERHFINKQYRNAA